MPASCVLYVPEAQGSLPLSPTTVQCTLGAPYVPRTVAPQAVERAFPEHAPLMPSTDGERRAFEAVDALERTFSGGRLAPNSHLIKP